MSSTNMTTSTKAVLAFIGALVIAGAIYGAYQYPKSDSDKTAGASAAGSSFSSAKIASQEVDTSTSTVFSQYNSDASDRYIQGSDVFLTGATSATSTVYALTCATSTTASGPGNGATSNILAVAFSASVNAYYGTTTSPGAIAMATSSPGVTGTSTPTGTDATLNQSYNQFARRWPTGTYLNCKLTTSGGSVSGLFDSNITGTISFPYRAQ